MLAVALDEAGVQPWLDPDIALAAVNSSMACILAGPPQAMALLQRRLEAEDVACRPVETSHAFHSPTLRPAAAAVTAFAATLKMQPPKIPYLSNVTGDWITAEQATARRATGPSICAGRCALPTLSAACCRHPHRSCWKSAREPRCPPSSVSTLCARATVWDRCSPPCPPSMSATPSWQACLPRSASSGCSTFPSIGTVSGRPSRRRRLPLPTYPFERQRYWVDPVPQAGPGGMATGAVQSGRQERRADVADWFAVASWNPVLSL